MSQPGNINYLFSTNACPSDETLKQYAFGTLKQEDKRMVELHLADCEMCNDMVEGMQISGSAVNFTKDIELIKAEASSRLKEKEIKIIPLYRRPYFSIAALIVILIGLGFLIRTLFNDPATSSMVDNQVPVKDDEVKATAASPVQETKGHPEAAVQKSIQKNSQSVETAPSPPQLAANRLEALADKTEEEKIKSTDANFSSGKAVLEYSADQGLAQDDRKAEVEQNEAITVAQDIATSGSTSTPSVQSPASIEVASTRSLSKKESADKFSVVSQSELQTAQEAFNKADYTRAKAVLKKELKSNPNQADALYLMGKTERMLKNYSNSNNYFSKLIGAGNSSYKEESEWQMALNFKDNKQKVEAKDLLTKISKGKGKYAYPAAELLGELDE